MSEGIFQTEVNLAENIRKAAYLICPDPTAEPQARVFPDTDLLCRKFAVALRKVTLMHLLMEFPNGGKWECGIVPLGDSLPAAANVNWHNLKHLTSLLTAAINAIIVHEAARPKFGFWGRGDIDGELLACKAKELVAWEEEVMRLRKKLVERDARISQLQLEYDLKEKSNDNTLKGNPGS